MGYSFLRVFGDSFSFGYGLEQDFEYYEHYLKPNNLNKKEFGVYLSAKLDLHLQQYAQSGSSNSSILRKVIENLYKFKKGDIVVIGLTESFRFETMLNSSDYTGGVDYSDQGWDYILVDSLDKSFMRPTTFKIMEEYIKHIHLETYEKRNKSIIRQITSIKDHLNNTLGINTIIWSWTDDNPAGTYIPVRMRKDVENIIDATNGRVEDHHPSYKGHEQLSNLLYKHIKENQKLIDFIK